ncbi:MAG: CoA ester lyase, partial [Clostridia bacterium]|nr:CoA ester lyase [Clostridia bacterium]
KALGFSGKASISPRHVEVINSVFSPSQKDVDYAYEVMEAIELAKSQGKGAISLYGKMIDAPIVNRAKQTIAMAEALGMRRGEA